MTPNFIYVFLILLINNRALSLQGFNFTPYENEGSHRDGKFLFDSFFGLEIEDELIANAGGTNTLKSCDCGQYLIGVIKKGKFFYPRLNKKSVHHKILCRYTCAWPWPHIFDSSSLWWTLTFAEFQFFLILLYHLSSVSLRCWRTFHFILLIAIWAFLVA